MKSRTRYITNKKNNSHRRRTRRRAGCSECVGSSPPPKGIQWYSTGGRKKNRSKGGRKSRDIYNHTIDPIFYAPSI